MRTKVSFVVRRCDVRPIVENMLNLDYEYTIQGDGSKDERTSTITVDSFVADAVEFQINFIGGIKYERKEVATSLADI